MNFTKVWYCFCLLFCVYCLGILVYEAVQVTYLADDVSKNEEGPLQYLACLGLERFRLNRTEIYLEDLRESLHRYLQERSLSRLILSLGDPKAPILKLAESPDKVVVMRNSVCIVTSSQSELEMFDRWLAPLDLFAFKESTFDWVKMRAANEKFDQLIVLNLAPPYSDCVVNFSRFRCFSECFKRKFRLSNYFYLGNETEPIHLQRSTNRSIREHEMGCFRECNKSACKIIYLSKSEEREKKEEVFTFKAQPRISKFDFNVQLMGLICLILDLSFSRLLHIAIEYANSKLRSRWIRSGLFYLRLFLLFIGMLCCACLFALMIFTYLYRVANPTRTETYQNLREPETVRLVVCVPVEYILGLPLESYTSLTMLELENATDGALNQTIESIHLDFLGKLTKIKWMVEPKTLFKDADFHPLMRCFQLTIHPREPQHQMLLSISKLKIRFKPNTAYELYLLAKDENLNSDSFTYSGLNSILRRSVKRSRLNGKCINYDEVYRHLKSCTTRRNCIERCMTRNYLESSGKVSTGPFGFKRVIEKELFNQSEWSTSYFSDSDDPNERAAREKCMKAIPDDKACLESKIEGSTRVRQPDEGGREMNLYYNVVRSVEDEPSWYKLVLDLLSIQSIFFGITLYELLNSFHHFIQTKWRVGANHSKSIHLLVCLFCLAGLSYHTYHIFDKTVNSPLKFSQYYEMAKRIRMPTYVFCFDNEQVTFARKHELTGNDLERMTKEVNAENIFESIAYLDDESRWIEMSSNFSSKHFRMETFYLLSKKCISIRFKIDYGLQQYHFTSGEVFRVKFKWSFIRGVRTAHFMTNHRTNRMQFSKVLKLIKFDNGSFWSSYKYFISQELFQIRFEDKFHLIRSSFKSHSPADYLRRLLEGFTQTHQKATLLLPLREELFHLQINDSLFENFSKQFEHYSKATASSNFELEYAINYLHMERQLYDADKAEDEIRKETGPDLSFSLIYFKKVIVATNDGNYSNLILNFLNALSLWLNGRLSNLLVYLLAIKRSLLRLYKALLNLGRLLFVPHS